jgi:hypothetical protein
MSPRQWLPVLIVFGLTLGNANGADPAPAPATEPAKLTRTKLEAARQTFEGYWKDKYWRDVEIPYRWSRRWLDAQRQLSAKQEEQVTAFRQHLDRMKGLEEITRQQFQDGGLAKVYEIHATEYYVAEAAEWLAQAKERGEGVISKGGAR